MNIEKSRISLEICKRLGVNTKNKTSGNLMVSCFEHEDKHPSMSINLDKGIWHCFSCGSSGTLTGKYWDTFHRSIYKDLGLKTGDFNLLSPTESEVKADFSQTPESDIYFDGKLYSVSITDAGKQWLKHRGFTEKDMNGVRAKYCQFGICKKNSDKENKKEWIYVLNRVLIPIYEGNDILSYELRDIMGETHYKKQLEKKGLTLDDHPYKKLLYPKNSSVNTLFDLKKLKTDEPLYVVEGLMDLISLRTHSIFKNSTCLFHNIPTERQYFLLQPFKKIIYVVNNDLPGVMGCKKLMERNSNVSFLCPPGKLNDVNDILRKKDPRFSTITELVEKWDWMGKVRSSMRDIDLKIKQFSVEERK
jgi:DNA primase